MCIYLCVSLSHPLEARLSGNCARDGRARLARQALVRSRRSIRALTVPHRGYFSVDCRHRTARDGEERAGRRPSRSGTSLRAEGSPAGRQDKAQRVGSGMTCAVPGTPLLIPTRQPRAGAEAGCPRIASCPALRRGGRVLSTRCHTTRVAGLAATPQLPCTVLYTRRARPPARPSDLAPAHLPLLSENDGGRLSHER